MATKLYIGNLPYNTTDDALKAHFEPAGEVTSAQVIRDRMTGRSRGFGFVEMANDEGAQQAIAMFNGKDFDGRSLVVNEARPLTPGGRPPRGPRSGFGGGRSMGGGDSDY